MMLLPAQEKLTRYLDPLSDFGFKHLFGNEGHKEIMIAFLNALFKGQKVITDLSYSATEYPGDHSDSKKVFFDLNCITQDGECFIMEMQRKSKNILKTGVFIMFRVRSTSSCEEENQTGKRGLKAYILSGCLISVLRITRTCSI